MNNNEVKKLLLLEFMIILISIISMYITVIIIDNDYKKEIINNYANVVNKIIEKNPDLESDIINTIVTNDKKYDKNIIKKYGLDNEESINLLYKNELIKNKTIKKVITIHSIFIIVISIIFLFFLIKLYKKIKGLSLYTNNILNDNYSMDIRSYEEGEISNLKNDLYKMTVKLKEQTDLSKKEQKYLEETLSDISHQLKTPLTSMYVINEVLSDDKIDKKTRKEFLNKEKNQLERIEWLISSILKMSRLDSGSVMLSKKLVNIDDLITKVIEPLKIPIELKEITLKKEYDKNIVINIDFNWTAESLINILKNAYEHTLNKGIIIISASDNPLYTLISIKDNGLGISKEDLPHIFERFYKGHTNKESIGIGLNMAKKIINKQNGDITVETSNKGTTFHVKFYKTKI